jgi:NADH:ubiquinone oxidoreductase subunit K
MIGEVVALIVIAVVAGVIGIGLGIFFLAPRLSRLAERMDEEPRDGDD